MASNLSKISISRGMCMSLLLSFTIKIDVRKIVKKSYCSFFDDFLDIICHLSGNCVDKLGVTLNMKGIYIILSPLDLYKIVYP